jgi:hypothetical protein
VMAVSEALEVRRAGMPVGPKRTNVLLRKGTV